jgi:UDP-N-acetylmuramoyl-L-alanyl-D-glutamate--2,6-diaminopimelate ligase
MSTLQAKLIVDVLKKAGLLLDARVANPSTVFSAYTTDSRQIQPQGLFIAYQGVRFDSHTLLGELSRQFPDLGVILDRSAHWEECRSFSFACLVKDSREAWAYLAAYRWGQPQEQLQLIGVTGTNGKTSTVWYVRQILAALGESCMTLGTLGVYCGQEHLPTQHTTPDPDDLFSALALAVQRGIKWVAMEASSHAIVQKRLGPIRFDAVAFTSFSRDHLDFHGTMEAYFAAKWELITHYRKPGGAAWLSHALGAWKPANAGALGCRTYGPDGANEGEAGPWELVYTPQDLQLSHSDVCLHDGKQSLQGRLPFGGDFTVDNFVVAWALVRAVSGLSLAGDRWQQIAPVPGRFEPVSSAFGLGLAVIVDYAHTPDALEKTLMKLRELTKGQLWVVFGCGGDRDRGKRPLMGRVAEQWADRVIVTSDNPRTEMPEAIIDDIIGGLHRPERAERQADRRHAIGQAILRAVRGDSILIAGKGHEDYQIIGQERLPFDDHKVAEEWIVARSASIQG